MKIVLLNPPGEKIYVRNYYCGSTSKAGYLFQPIDLVMFSGILSEEHTIKVMDSIAQRLNGAQVIEQIISFQADVVVCVVSMVSWDADRTFLKQLKEAIPALRIIANGDVFFDESEKIMMDNPWLDAVTFDFISDDLNSYLRGTPEKVVNMMYRENGQVVVKRMNGGGNIFTVPIPRHELFLNKNYCFPFARHYPFATVIATFGCPFRCSFCIANALGFKYRRAEEVMGELRYIASLKIREIFFEDMSFGLPRENIVQLCKMMIVEKLRFGWTCFSRVDILDRELLLIMKQAGCHTIMFGVESGDEDILKKYSKDLNKIQIKAMFKMCREQGINTVATFILGFPEDTERSCVETIRFAKEIDCDYASFNIAVPRPGTALRRNVLESKTIGPNDLVFDHSGLTARSLSPELSADKLLELKQRAVREFYLRPSYLFRRLLRIRSFYGLREHWQEFLELVLRNKKEV
jgi:anaerobic magnesium-protoporphyrin IX monomethyl ester cyclase